MMVTREAWRKACESQLNKPYIWGKEGPDAYDCSGFAQWALALLNLDPPGDQTAEGLYRFFRKGRSTPVLVNEADLGDVIFFGSDESVTHVALAWGQGKMLEAGGGGRTTTSVAEAQRQGAKVRIVDISRRHDLVGVLRPKATPWFADLGSIEGTLLGTNDWGSYLSGAPLVEWLGDGRHMQLKRPFGYVQASGKEWHVPEDAVVDGASIPRAFWSLIGGPFEGDYRNASIVHDYYCDTRTQPWPDTHRVFYDAMRCSGVGDIKAKVMYYAVYRFGPRWTNGPSAESTVFESVDTSASVASPLPMEAFDATSFEADAKLIESGELDLIQIEKLAESRSEDLLPDEVTATFSRLPTLQQLVELQDIAADQTSAEAAGSLLCRYSSTLRSEKIDSALEAAPAFEVLQPEYDALFRSCVVAPERAREVSWHVNKLLQYRPRYEKVASATGTPWWFIGIVHALEASFNFNAHLHNGDSLSGRTVQVPAGRPTNWNPPNDWEISAIPLCQDRCRVT